MYFSFSFLHYYSSARLVTVSGQERIVNEPYETHIC